MDDDRCRAFEAMSGSINRRKMLKDIYTKYACYYSTQVTIVRRLRIEEIRDVQKHNLFCRCKLRRQDAGSLCRLMYVIDGGEACPDCSNPKQSLQGIT